VSWEDTVGRVLLHIVRCSESVWASMAALESKNTAFDTYFDFEKVAAERLFVGDPKVQRLLGHWEVTLTY
jgi:hypothetical protein